MAGFTGEEIFWVLQLETMAADETSSSHLQSTGKRRLFWCLVAATSFFAVASVCLTGTLIWREQTRDDNGDLNPRNKPFKCPQNAAEIRSKFLGYFYTAEDVARMKLLGLVQYRPVVNSSIGMPNVSFTSSTTTTSAPSRNRRQVVPTGFCTADILKKPDLIVHACCISYSNLEDPSSLPTGEPGKNGNVTLYKTDDHKQYFKITRCCQRPKCNYNCECNQLYQLETAVVVLPNSRGTLCQFQFVRVPNCCICLN